MLRDEAFKIVFAGQPVQFLAFTLDMVAVQKTFAILGHHVAETEFAFRQRHMTQILSLLVRQAGIPEAHDDLLRWSRQSEESRSEFAKMVKGWGQGSLWLNLSPESARQLGIRENEARGN
jgi:hypothetical protein